MDDQMEEEPIMNSKKDSQPKPSSVSADSGSLPSSRTEGGWLSFILSAVFLVGIFGEILYLTKDFAIRKDLTQEHLYSLSGSTKRVLAKLKEPLVIEAYFSKKIPGYFVETRNKIENFLDEYRKSSKGKIEVVYLDPLKDERTREKASRLGIQGRQVQTLGSDSLSVQQLYQGLRLRYGGDKQYVIPFVVSPNALESQLTPKIQELVLGKKPKVAFFVRPKANPNPFMRQKNQTPSWDMVERALGERYEVSRMDVSQGQLLPEDLDVLVVIEPKDLSDWEKFCIDQHVMRGGNLIVFEDAADYDMTRMGMFRKIDFVPDAKGSKVFWKDQLGSYGVEISDKLAVEMIPRFWERYFEVVRDRWGQGAIKVHPYPFWFNVYPYDWKKLAPQLVAKGDDPKSLAKTVEKGMDVDHPVLKGLAKLDFFWATPVGIKTPLPKGIEGKVLVRTSPRAMTETPGPVLSPSQPNLLKEREARALSEPLRQLPLVVSLKGKFTSFFKGKEIPERPGSKTPKEKGGGLLQKKLSQKNTSPKKTESKKASPVGPPPPGKDASGKQKEKEDKIIKLDQAKKEGRIVVLGDASMIRDDFIMGIGPVRQPQSQTGAVLFSNLLDWMALDLDLVELRNLRSVDRKLKFVDDVSGKMNFEEYKSLVARKKKRLRLLNVLGPVLGLLLLGFVIWMVRNTEKRRFLSQVQDPDFDGRIKIES